MATKQKSKSAANTSNSRVRKLDYRSKKKAIRASEPIAGSVKILSSSLKHVWANKKLFGSILLVYLVLYVFLVKGLANNFQLNSTKQAIEEAVGSELGNFGMGLALFGTLVGSSGSVSSESANVYQTFLFMIMSLAIIWSLRQTFETNKPIGVLKVFYSSTYPLIAYILVWLVVLLQLIPAALGSMLYSIVVANNIAVGAIEQTLWLIVLLASIGVSVYWISSSVFATYIVTLPGMAPLTALKKARQLVKFRRLLIIRKLLFLPIVIAVFALIVFMPLVLYAAIAAEILFLVFSLALVLVAHTYVYMLYREMI